jgi:DNA/RNA endonuclease G (NUC1)
LALKDDSIHIWAGSVGVAKKVGTVSVPTKCWKVIYIKKTKEYMAFVFNNTTDKPSGLESHKVALDDVEKLTHFKFKD